MKTQNAVRQLLQRKMNLGFKNIYNVCLGQQYPPDASGGFVVLIASVIDNPGLKYLIFFIFLWYEIRI
jgi:hypothetical protein